MRRDVMDGNTAVAHVAYRVNEVCAIFPITPSSTMAELADEWSAEGSRTSGAMSPWCRRCRARAAPPARYTARCRSGALTTTFTASQGLMLMLPNMFKIAGELTPTVFHVAARALATQALSIFGDHSDVMAARTTGFALLSSASVQEAHDAALIAQAATLGIAHPVPAFLRRVPHLARVNTIELLSDADPVDDRRRPGSCASRARAQSRAPFIRGTAHNPDTFFQARETANPFYAACRRSCRQQMDRFAALTGRHYHLFDY